MFEKLERKLVNVLLFFDLFKMKTKIPEDFSGVMRTQDKRVRKLVKRAYEIPFYRIFVQGMICLNFRYLRRMSFVHG